MLRKLLAILILLGCVSSYAYEDRRTIQNMVTHDSLGTYATIAVPTTSVVTADSQSLVNTGLATNVGIMYKASSPGTVTLSLQALRSYDRPNVEGQNDVKYVGWNVSQSVSDTNWHVATLDTVIMPYFTYKITGSGSNDAGTTIQIKVEKL